LTVNAISWLTIKKELAEAFGRPVPEGFLVRAGSTAMRNGSPQEKRNRPERDRLVREGILKESDNPELLVFAVDHVFSSQSAAAGVVIDGNSNGNHWKSESGVPSDGPQARRLSRAAVENAMDEYDRFVQLGESNSFLSTLHDPRGYWVRSTRKRENPVYASKAIAVLAGRQLLMNDGWSDNGDAAAWLHNSGFIIVDESNRALQPPERYAHIIGDADRIRLCALNYYIEPARERNDQRVSIRAGTLGREMGLRDATPTLCSTLGGEIFQRLAGVPAPSSTEPNPSTTTTFTYRLGDTIETVKRATTNLILYGPPGTGKTYETAKEAVGLCLGETAAAAFTKRDALMMEYRRLVSEGRIEFVTFHQSFSYEDFVEGLRPTTSPRIEDGASDTAPSGGFSLEPRDGAFKRLSERARLDTGTATEERLDRSRAIFKVSLGPRGDGERVRKCLDDSLIHLDRGGQIDWSALQFDEFDAILQTWQADGNPDATGYDVNVVQMWSFRASMQVGDYVVVSDSRDRFYAVGRVAGEYYFVPGAETHPHRRQVEWIWEDPKGVERSSFYASQFRPSAVYQLNASVIDWDGLESVVSGADRSRPLVTARDFVLIIDEINRANISKVFGELITLLEVDKRLGCENEILLQLPYSGTPFGVPANLHIIGTMNTADRSIALLDTALRRRFSFRELMPDPSALEDVDGISLSRLLATLNDRIEYLFDRDHLIGHAYFIRCSTRKDVEDVMRHKVIPLLAEYFYEDWSKVAAVLGEGSRQNGFIESSRIRPPAGLADEESGGDKLRWFVKERFDFSEFQV
jgi:5-methylcytosine-specific restriction protein B